ncbi:MAG: DUF2157 domain-containing protein [Ferruginibacter sp.]
MNLPLLDQLHAEGLISRESFQKTKSHAAIKLFSLHWELKTILYLGVMLLSGGLGILVYKNIDSIGHQVILLFIALVCAGCFFYCLKNKLPFSTLRVKAPNSFFDYILLLGCLMFITFIAYFQYQYNVFGSRYGLAVFFPMVVLFFSAYYFDHLGILSLAITNLAAWLGITVTPLHILQANDFNSNTIIYTSVFLGVLLIVLALGTEKKNIKKHFAFTYTNFGLHILFISCLAGMFYFNSIYLLWFLFLAVLVFYFYTKAIADKFFYLLLFCTLYAYTGISYVVIRTLSYMSSLDMAAVYLGLIYFIISGIMLVAFLMRTNKKMKADDSI